MDDVDGRFKIKVALSVDLAATGIRIVNAWIAQRFTVAALLSIFGVILLLIDAIIVARQ